MTRFSSKALPQYTPEPYQSPMAGIWNMLSAWYSTSPEFRESLANLFRSTKEGETGMEQGFDTTMAYPELADVPEFGSPEAAADVSKILVGTADDETNLDWLRGIAEDVRNSNDYQGDSIRRQLMASIPQLKKGGW